MSARTRMLVALPLLVVLASCGSNPPVGPPTPALPPRTANVAANDISPCDMLTSEQQRTLGLRAETPTTVTVDELPSPTCTWISASGIDFNVQFIPVDAQRAATAPGATIRPVDRFYAVQDVPADTMGGTAFCQLTIDVAENQSIRIQAKTRPGGPQPGIDEQCRHATEVASMVMTTVVATASR